MINVDKAINILAGYAGIAPEFRDLEDISRPTSRETNMALLRACGWEIDNDASILETLKHAQSERKDRLLPEEVISPVGRKFNLKVPGSVVWNLSIESAENNYIEGQDEDQISLPALPSGVHKLEVRIGNKIENIRVIIAPLAAPSIASITGIERMWGVNAALYGLHSKRNPSLGDFEDLATISKCTAQQGADFLGINPVHAIGWQSNEVISPYSPTHRGFLNSNHIALDKIEPASDKSRALIARLNEYSGSRTSEFVEYEQYLIRKKEILSSLYNDFCELASQKQEEAFKEFCTNSNTLSMFTKFEVLSEKLGSDWRHWSSSMQASSFDENQEKRQKFHAWLQWQAKTQLNAAHDCARASGMGLGLYLDLAVGSRRNGAEAWSEKDSIAQGVSVGAPPDHLSPAGQNWDLAAYAPQKLASNDYRAFRDILSSNMQHCGVLRIDHVLGLNRSFWLPDNGARGGYIFQNFEAMLAILRIEADRSQTAIIGEDLGLVPKGFRAQLSKSGFYSYSVLQYEKNKSGKFRKPKNFRKQTLACFGTHDTPTLTGYEKCTDINWWQKLGWIDEATAISAQKKRKQECSNLLEIGQETNSEHPSKFAKSLGNLNSSVHELLAASPVVLLAVQLDDIEQQPDAQNIPGTIDEHPNWRRRYPTSVEKYSEHTGLSAMGQLMKHNGRSNANSSKRVSPK